MENDVYITIPKVTRVIYSKNDSKVLVPKLAEQNDKNGRNPRSVKQPQKATEIIPRPPQRINALTTNFPPFEAPKSTTEEHQSKTTPTTTTIKQAPIISVMPTIRTIVATAIRPSTTRRPPTTTRTPATKAKTLLNYSAKTTHMPIDIAMTTPKQQENKIEKQMKLQALHNVQPGPTNSKV